MALMTFGIVDYWCRHNFYSFT